MGGYVLERVNEEIHNEDRCPSYEARFADYVCAEYEGGKILYSCSGHRDKDISRSMSLANYGKGSVIQNSGFSYQHTALSNAVQQEINDRKQHKWYRNIHDFYCKEVVSGDIISCSQENVINDAIDELNRLINTKYSNDICADWGISKKDDTTSHKVLSGDATEAEDLKYLERNVLAAYRDCICYSDCTAHGISSYTKRVWCSSYGSSGDGFYF